MSPRGRRGAPGFSLIEALVVLCIFAVLLAVGVPRMTAWVATNKASAAAEFYAEGFRMARLQAVSHNAASRIALTQNPDNGQMDWQIDLCFPTPAVPCSAVSGTWSTTAAPAPGDPEGAAGFTSIQRVASALPPQTVVTPTLSPAGAFSIYYTALGWVDTNFGSRMTRIQLDPGPSYVGKILPAAVVVTLAGVASKCDPDAALTDSRACPP